MKSFYETLTLANKHTGQFHPIYRKVESVRPVYYPILEHFGQRPQYISIKFPLHKHSENVKTLRQATVCDFTVYIAE